VPIALLRRIVITKGVVRLIKLLTGPEVTPNTGVASGFDLALTKAFVLSTKESTTLCSENAPSEIKGTLTEASIVPVPFDFCPQLA
jgi:hypothetical protein